MDETSDKRMVLKLSGVGDKCTRWRRVVIIEREVRYDGVWRWRSWIYRRVGRRIEVVTITDTATDTSAIIRR